MTPAATAYWVDLATIVVLAGVIVALTVSQSRRLSEMAALRAEVRDARLEQRPDYPEVVVTPGYQSATYVVRAHDGQRELVVRSDCDGGPGCTAELSIRVRGLNDRPEVHLNRNEAAAVWLQLGNAIRTFDRER